MHPGGQNAAPGRSETAPGGSTADARSSARVEAAQGPVASAAPAPATANAPTPAEPGSAPHHAAPSAVVEAKKSHIYLLARFQSNDIIRIQPQPPEPLTPPPLPTKSLKPLSAPEAISAAASAAAASASSAAAAATAAGGGNAAGVPSIPPAQPLQPLIVASGQSHPQRNRSSSLGSSPSRRCSVTPAATPRPRTPLRSCPGRRGSASSGRTDQRGQAPPQPPSADQRGEPLQQRASQLAHEVLAQSASALKPLRRGESPPPSRPAHAHTHSSLEAAAHHSHTSMIDLHASVEEETPPPPPPPPPPLPPSPSPNVASPAALPPTTSSGGSNEKREDETAVSDIPQRTGLNSIPERSPTESKTASTATSSAAPAANVTAVPAAYTNAAAAPAAAAATPNVVAAPAAPAAAAGRDSDASSVSCSSTRRAVVPKSMALRRILAPRRRRPLLWRSRSRSPTPRTSAAPSPSASQAGVAPSASAGALILFPTPPPPAPPAFRTPRSPPSQAQPPAPAAALAAAPAAAPHANQQVPPSLFIPLPPRASYVLPATAPRLSLPHSPVSSAASSAAAFAAASVAFAAASTVTTTTTPTATAATATADDEVEDARDAARPPSQTPRTSPRYPRLAVYATDATEPQPLEIVEWHVSRGDLVVTCAPASPLPRRALTTPPRSIASLDASTQEGEPMREAATQDDHRRYADAATDPHAGQNVAHPPPTTADVATNPPSARTRAEISSKPSAAGASEETKNITEKEETVREPTTSPPAPSTSEQIDKRKESIRKVDLESPDTDILKTNKPNKFSLHRITTKGSRTTRELDLLPVTINNSPGNESQITDEQIKSRFTQEQDSTSTPSPTTNTQHTRTGDASEDFRTQSPDIKNDRLLTQHKEQKQEPVVDIDVAVIPSSGQSQKESSNESSQTEAPLPPAPTRVQTAPPLLKRTPDSLVATFLAELTSNIMPNVMQGGNVVSPTTETRDDPSETSTVVLQKSDKFPAQVQVREVSKQTNKKDVTQKSIDKSHSKLTVDTTSNKNLNPSSAGQDLVGDDETVLMEGEIKKGYQSSNEKFTKFENIVKNTPHPTLNKDEKLVKQSRPETNQHNEKEGDQVIRKKEDPLLQISVTSVYKEFSRRNNIGGNANDGKVSNWENLQDSFNGTPQNPHHQLTKIHNKLNDDKGIPKGLETEQMVNFSGKTSKNRSSDEIHLGKDSTCISNEENSNQTKQNIAKQLKSKEDRLPEGGDTTTSIIQKAQSQIKTVPLTSTFGEKKQHMANGSLANKNREKYQTHSSISASSNLQQTEHGKVPLSESKSTDNTNANHPQKGVFSAPTSTTSNTPTGPTFFGPAGAVWNLNKWSPSTSMTKTSAKIKESHKKATQGKKQELSQITQIEMCGSEIISNEPKKKFNDDQDDRNSESKHSKLTIPLRENESSFYISSDLLSTTAEHFPRNANALVEETNPTRHDTFEKVPSKSSMKRLKTETLLTNDSRPITRPQREEKIPKIQHNKNLLLLSGKNDTGLSDVTKKNTSKTLSSEKSFHQQMKSDRAAASSLKKNLLIGKQETSNLHITTQPSKECSSSNEFSKSTTSELYTKNQLPKISSTFVPVSEYLLPQFSGRVAIDECDKRPVSTRLQLFADSSTITKVSSAKKKSSLDTSECHTDRRSQIPSKDLTDILINESTTTPAVSLTIATPIESTKELESNYDITGTIAKMIGRPFTAPIPKLRDSATLAKVSTENVVDNKESSPIQSGDVTSERSNKNDICSIPREDSPKLPLSAPSEPTSASKVSVSAKKVITLSSAPSQELGTISPHMVESSTTDSEYERMRLEEIEKTLRFRLPTTSLATTIAKSEDGSSLVNKHSSKRTVVFAQNNETEILHKEGEPYTTDFQFLSGSSHLHFAIVPNANAQRSPQAVEIQPNQEYGLSGNIHSLSLTSASSVVRFLPAERCTTSKSKNNYSPDEFGRNPVKSTIHLNSPESKTYQNKSKESQLETIDWDTSTLARRNDASSKTNFNPEIHANEESRAKTSLNIISSNYEARYTFYNSDEITSKNSVQGSGAVTDDSRIKLLSCDSILRRDTHELSSGNEPHSSPQSPTSESKEPSHTELTNDEALPSIFEEGDHTSMYKISHAQVQEVIAQSETSNAYKRLSPHIGSDWSDSSRGQSPYPRCNPSRSPTPKRNSRRSIFARLTCPNSSKCKVGSNKAPPSKTRKSKKTLANRMSDVLRNQFRSHRSIPRSPGRSTSRSPKNCTSGRKSNVRK